jgi:signal transduction histidine kinase
LLISAGVAVLGGALTRVELDMNAVVVDGVVDLHARSGPGDVDVEDLPSMWGDDVQVRAVTQNLVANALKYSPSSTDVLIRLEVRQPVVRVSVIDAGPGIPADETRQLFGRYQRAATANGTEGNGLGLYVSKRIIEAHGGHIGVYRRHGAGSCCFFELPLTS